MAKKDFENVRAVDCVAAIRARYPVNEGYALMEQVGNSMGWKAHRWADIIAMSLWPSRGILIHGFEVKISRADWKKELKDPEKAEEIFGFCDRWWVVAPKGMIEPRELPPTWGLYEIKGRKAHVAVEASVLSPKPVSKEFLGAILRRAADAFDDVIRRERHAAREEGAKDGHGELAMRLKHAEESEEMMRKTIETFEAKSGLSIDKWNVGKIAKAVKTLTDSAHWGTCLRSLENEQALYRRRLEIVERDIEVMRKVTPADLVDDDKEEEETG